MGKNVLRPGDVFQGQGGKTYTVKTEDDWVIYKDPVPGGKYVLGADVAEGTSNGDWSVAVILDRVTGEEVAFFRKKLPPDTFGEILDKMGRKYNNALMVVEINNNGLTTITRLKQLLYPMMYFRPAKFDTVSGSWSDKLGWRTNTVTRPIMIDDLVAAIREESLVLHTPEFQKEMLTFVYDDSNKAIAQDGFHDDCIFALAVALQGFKSFPTHDPGQINESYIPSFGGY